MQSLGFKIMFSAPASSRSLPVELIFGKLKKTNVQKYKTPLIESDEALCSKDLSHCQKLMTKVAKYFVTLEHLKIN